METKSRLLPFWPAVNLFMDGDHRHRILVVDPDEQVGKAIDHVLQRREIGYTFADCGESALNEIKKIKKPFSVIISDQHLNDMDGTRLLEQAKTLTPDSIRFLMAAASEINIIIKAVNSGALQRYIVKPWEQNDFAAAILWGIQRYDFLLENKKLLTLAKKQNAQLYELNCELMETTKSHNRVIHELDIEIIKRHLSFPPPLDANALLDEIENWIKAPQGIDSGKAHRLFSDTLRRLYSQFKDVACQNGFEMPDIHCEQQ